jgi:hypothetical protein
MMASTPGGHFVPLVSVSRCPLRRCRVSQRARRGVECKSAVGCLETYLTLSCLPSLANLNVPRHKTHTWHRRYQLPWSYPFLQQLISRTTMRLTVYAHFVAWGNQVLGELFR